MRRSFVGVFCTDALVLVTRQQICSLLKNGLFVSRTRRLLENRRKPLKQEQQTGEGLRAWSTITTAMDAAAKDTETAFTH